MSLDLTLLPFGFPDHEYTNYAHTSLTLQTNNRGLMDAITQLAKMDQPQSVGFIKDENPRNGLVPEGFTCHLATDKEGESCYGECKEDAYGYPLRWLRASEILKVDPILWRNPQDKAALGYIRELHKDHRIALYWS